MQILTKKKYTHALRNLIKPMSKFMIYNADEVTFILKKTLDEARQWAIMYCDHSDEIIVREISNIKYKY